MYLISIQPDSSNVQSQINSKHIKSQRQINSGGASAVKEPDDFRSLGVRGVAMTLHWGCTFFLKIGSDFFYLVVALKTQAANAADNFTVKIKQIKRSDMVTFLFSVHTITEAKQQSGQSQGGGSSSPII